MGEHVYLHILNNAKKYVYINTPYLIVDDSMLSALRLAAKSGVDIRIITPHRWDKWWVHMTTRSYYRELIKSGVKIYEYTNGFIHSKTFVSDDRTATVGTTNLDFRSCYGSQGGFSANAGDMPTGDRKGLQNKYRSASAPGYTAAICTTNVRRVLNV